MSNLSTTFPAWLTLGVAVGFAWILLANSDRQPAQDRQPLSRVKRIDGSLAGLAAGVLSARLAYVLLHWQAYATEPASILAVWQGGIVGWAGWIGAIVGLGIYCRIVEAPFWRMADSLALPAALIVFFGWLGCLQDGCAYGRIADGSALAVSAPDWTGVVRRRWPTQAIGALSAVGAIAWVALRRRASLQPGMIASVTLAILATGSLVVAFLRADPAAAIAGLRHDWVGSSLLLISGLGLSLWRSNRAEEAD